MSAKTTRYPLSSIRYPQIRPRSSVNGGMPYPDTLLSRYADELAELGSPIFNQGLGAELIATRWNLSRAQLDEFSLASHERAAAAIDGGRFEGQIAPVTLSYLLPKRSRPPTTDHRPSKIED